MPSIRIPAHVLFEELEGEVVLLDAGSSRYYGLDEVGARAWRLWAEHGSTEVAIAALLTEYEVEEATLRRELDELLGRLAAKGLVAVDGSIDGQ
jgi:hypothetical protein